MLAPLAFGALGARDAGGGAEVIPAPTFGLFDGLVARLKALNTTWHRVAAHWDTIEPVKGTFDFSALDARVIPASRAGIRVIIAIHSNAAWGTVCQARNVFSTPADRPAFRRFVRALVERYDGDGVDDAPGLVTPVKVWQIENQWVTATFYRGRDNCPAVAPGASTQRVNPDTTGDPRVAARDFVAEYRAAYAAILEADPEALVGPGNLPSMMIDYALFCQGRLGPRLTQNLLRVDGSVRKTIRWTRAQVCNRAGPNSHGIKSFVRYNRVVLEGVMPRLAGKVDYLDLAQYGRYENVPLRNRWAQERLAAWRLNPAPALVSWELAGTDRRALAAGPNPDREVALDLPKRISLAFATGSRAVTWFHFRRNPKAAVGVRFTSLLDEAGRPTPAFFNYRLMTRHLQGAVSAELETLDGGYLVRFTRNNGRQVLVAWADRGLDVTVPVKHRAVRVIAATGRRSLPAVTRPAPGRLLPLRLSEVPLIIIDQGAP